MSSGSYEFGTGIYDPESNPYVPVANSYRRGMIPYVLGVNSYKHEPIPYVFVPVPYKQGPGIYADAGKSYNGAVAEAGDEPPR
jgi:hypothetical protein